MQSDTLGSYLLELRQARGLSPTKLAERAQVARATLYNWERGRFQPRLQELESVLQALDASQTEQARALGLMAAPRAHKALKETGELIAMLPHGGDLLRALRLRRGWTQGHLAAQIKINQATIARWERGESWPIPETLHRLCVILRASKEEFGALASGIFGLSGVGRNESERWTLDALEARLADVERQVLNPERYALGDLLYLGLEAQIIPLSQKCEQAQLLLATILLSHAKYLGERCQPAEAGRLGERALDLLPSRGDQWNGMRLMGEMFWIVWKYPIRDHAKHLRPWLDYSLPLHRRTWIRGQIAASLLNQGENDAALELERESLALVEENGDTTRILHQRNSYAETLLEVGRASEAAATLVLTDAMPPPVQLRTKLTLSEAHLAARNRSRAQDWLMEASADNAVLNVSYYQPQIDSLAERL